MSNKIIESMRKYDLQYVSAKSAYNTKLQELQKKYGTDGEVYKTSKAELDSEHEKNMSIARESLKHDVNAAFDEYAEKITKFITAPIPAELAQIVQSIKTISDTEAKALISEYPGSYFARKAILSLTDRESILAAHYVTYDEIMQTYEEQETAVSSWLESYNPDTYSHTALIDEETSPILLLDKEIADFIGQ